MVYGKWEVGSEKVMRCGYSLWGMGLWRSGGASKGRGQGRRSRRGRRVSVNPAPLDIDEKNHFFYFSPLYIFENVIFFEVVLAAGPQSQIHRYHLGGTQRRRSSRRRRRRRECVASQHRQYGTESLAGVGTCGG